MAARRRADRPGTGDAPDRAAPGTLADGAYRALRRDIIQGSFAPGQPLRLELLRQRYGLSFSPLREALNRLQSERLVVSAALRGFSVSPLSTAEMWDATETRILIECEALRRSVKAGDDDWEAAIVAAFHALDLQVRRLKRDGEAADASILGKRHHEFHRALIARCGSNRLIEIADQLHAETERYRIPTLTGRSKPEAARDVPEEHRQIMQAALARETERAAELLAQHYRRTALAVGAS